MRRAVDRMMRNNKKSTFVLQLTAMVDMFTILIVFLLKSFSTSAVNITPHAGLKMPYSTTQKSPVEALRLVVATDGVYVEDKKIIVITDGKISQTDTEINDPDFVKPLFELLDKEAMKSKKIALKNEEHEFQGTVVMQVDSRLSYKLIRKIMYTSSLAGYADLRMATVSMN